MPNNDANWTTVSGKTKPKGPASSTKPSGIPVMPKAEVKAIKLSDSAFSSMKDRMADENNENETDEVKVSKTTSTTVDKNVPSKATKPSKPTSNTLSLKQALQNINIDKLKQLYKSSKDNTSLWIDKICYWFIEQLKDVTSGLGDPTFSKETSQDFPMNALPSSVRDYLNDVFDLQAKLKAVALCRAGILNVNADTHSIVTYQILLQYFLRNLDERPDESFFNEIDELSATLKRYQSDRVLRLLWAYGQVQYEQPGLALDIWFRLMFPFIENRTYNQLIVENLIQLITRNEKNKKFLQSDEIFPIESYMKLLEFLDQPNPALTRDMRTLLANSAFILSNLFVQNANNIAEHSTNYFKALFPFVSIRKQRSKKVQSLIDRMIIACFTDKSIVITWMSLHENYPRSSLQLLSLLNTNKTPIPGLSSSKEIRNTIQQLQTISNEAIVNDENENEGHDEFLSAYTKTNMSTINRSEKRSKLRIGFILKLFVVIAISFLIYRNWLWLTVATEYLLEDYLEHPTVLVLKDRLSDAYIETKRLGLLSLTYGEKFVYSTMKNIEPYAVKCGQYIQKQWSVLLKYVEGPGYDKMVEIAEQIRKLSIVVFNQSVHYLHMLFDWASYYTANLTYLAEIYITQIYEILHDKWTHFNATELGEKLNELIMHIVKSV